MYNILFLRANKAVELGRRRWCRLRLGAVWRTVWRMLVWRQVAAACSLCWVMSGGQTALHWGSAGKTHESDYYLLGRGDHTQVRIDQIPLSRSL